MAKNPVTNPSTTDLTDRIDALTDRRMKAAAIVGTVAQFFDSATPTSDAVAAVTFAWNRIGLLLSVAQDYLTDTDD